MKNTIRNVIFFVSIISLTLCLFYMRQDFKKDLFENNKYLVSKINDLKYEKKALNKSFKSTNDKNSVHVLVIGESANRNHHGIYGYVRNTTPNLSNIEGSLIKFSDVISATPRTNSSLRKALTLVQNNNFGFSDFSIIQMMNSVGYETYWVSNQKPKEQIKGNKDKTNPNNYTDKIITTISNASDYKFFCFSNEKNHTDEIILPILDSILEKNTNKKFIVIHLAGSHKPYVDKYPKDFNKNFDLAPNYKYLNKDNKLKLIDEYDMSTAYTDQILSRIINSLESCNEAKNITLTYFSDHGEELYQDADFIGHSNRFITKNMFRVPFIIWSNNSSFITKKKSSYAKKHTLEDLIYTLSDLYKISFTGYDPSKSILSDSFVNRPRIITYGEKTKSFDTKW